MIRPINGKYEVTRRGVLRGVFADPHVAAEFDASLPEEDPALCPNCRRELGWSEFYAKMYCFHCHFIPKGA